MGDQSPVVTNLGAISSVYEQVGPLVVRKHDVGGNDRGQIRTEQLRPESPSHKQWPRRVPREEHDDKDCRVGRTEH